MIPIEFHGMKKQSSFCSSDTHRAESSFPLPAVDWLFSKAPLLVNMYLLTLLSWYFRPGTLKIHVTLTPPYGGGITVPHFTVRKLSHKEVVQVIWGHSTNKCRAGFGPCLPSPLSNHSAEQMKVNVQSSWVPSSHILLPLFHPQYFQHGIWWSTQPVQRVSSQSYSSYQVPPFLAPCAPSQTLSSLQEDQWQLRMAQPQGPPSAQPYLALASTERWGTAWCCPGLYLLSYSPYSLGPMPPHYLSGPRKLEPFLLFPV